MTDNLKSIIWEIDNLENIGGNKVTVLGSPKVIDSARGKAIEFDGTKDGLIIDDCPLAGIDKFTIEVIFKPYANGLEEQRFVHLQEENTESRVLIELRSANNEWFFNTFIKSGETNQVLSAKDFKHQTDVWYHGALVFDGKEMRHYVNGIKEMSAEIKFTPLEKGKTSIGVRINQVSWFKGAIKEIHFTPEVIQPEDFIQI